MSKIVTITSTKGGVGKTTLAANLGGMLADLGQRILLVDADVQPTLSSYFELRERAPFGLSALLMDEQAREVRSQTVIPGLDVVVSDDTPRQLPDWITHTSYGRSRLRDRLGQLAAGYDFVLIDTQGAIGPVQDAAILAADLLLSPIPPEMLSARELARGTLQRVQRLRGKRRLAPDLGPLVGLLYRVDRTVDAWQIGQELRREAARGEGLRILATEIPSTVAYREAASAREPVHRFEPRRRGPTPSGLATMRTLVRELFPEVRTGSLASTGPRRLGGSAHG